MHRKFIGSFTSKEMNVTKMQINMKKQVLFLGMIMLMTLSIMAQPGQPGRDGQGPNRNQNGDRLDRIAEKLELTPEQKTKFDELMVANYKVMKPIQNELAEKSVALKSLTTSDQVDQKKIDKVIGEIGTLETSLLKAKTNHQIAIRAMLTDKQKMMFDMSHEKRAQGKGKPSGGPMGKPSKG